MERPAHAVPPHRGFLGRAVRKVAGGYDWDRLTVGGEAAICWDERTGVPVALSGVPTLTGVIWLTEHGRKHWTDPVARRALARSTVFVNSPQQLVDLREEWGLPVSRTHFVPFGIDADFWQAQDGERDGVLIVGNDRHRDHPTALRAAGLATARVTLVTQQPLSAAGVVRVPHLSHRELRRAYADHAVVAVATVPNRHASGLTVVLEAMACGRPVVATDCGGLDEYVSPNVGGLVPPGDSNTMAVEIQRLLDDPERAEALGRAGRAAVEDRYNSGALASSLATLARTL